MTLSRRFIPGLPVRLSLALILCACSDVPAATTNVVASGLSFSPKAITIQAGDKVIWTGLSGVHSVTGDTPPETLCGNAFPASCTNVFNTPGTYLYHCINHLTFGMTGVVNVTAVPLPPTVIITNPAGGDVFAAPASVRISALATNATGPVTNVQFFNNGSLLGAVTAAPFSFTTAPLAAGSQVFTAKATASTGLSATSAPVSISVVTPAAVSNYLPRIVDDQFVFNHTANPGLRYVVERGTALTNWVPVSTNTAVSNSVEAKDVFQVGNLRFYRIGRLPNL